MRDFQEIQRLVPIRRAQDILHKLLLWNPARGSTDLIPEFLRSTHVLHVLVRGSHPWTITNSRNMVRNWTKLIIVQSIPVVLTSVLPERVILCKFKIFFTCSVSSSWTVKTSPLERLYQLSHKKKLKNFNLSLARLSYQCNNHVTIIYYCILIVYLLIFIILNNFAFLSFLVHLNHRATGAEIKN